MSAGARTAVVAWLVTAVYYFYQYTLRSAPAVMNAAKLIKSGEVFELAHVLGPSMAFFGTRRFDVHTKRTFMNQFSNMRGSNEEVIITELGQVGTQFDGFAAPADRVNPKARAGFPVDQAKKALTP